MFEEMRTDAARIDRIRELEVLKCRAAAEQAVLAAELDANQRVEQADRGVKAEHQGRGVAAQIALARRESPHRGQQHLALATVLPREMPHTMAAFRDGRITEFRAQLLLRETACLSLADRRRIDEAVAGDAARLEAMGDGETVSMARKLAYALDPVSFVQRRRHAEADRRVTLRPAPDVMAYFSALLPVAQGVLLYATLTRHADRLRAAGDPRSKGQIMADTLVERITGRSVAGEVPVNVNVVISDEALLGSSETSGHVDGYGPVPAELVRELATGAARATLRRLYVAPRTGRLVAMESGSRIFPQALATMIRLRDQTCRTPYCDAPVRHIDHVRSVDEGGGTSLPNGQGLCEQCNYAKQAPGWRARPRPGPGHEVETTTPTGHRYRSHAPPQPAPARLSSPMEIYFRDLVLTG